MKIVLLGLAVGLLGLLSLFIGVADLSVSALLAADSQAMELLLVSRLPRLVAICLAGAGMSIAGLIMQQLLQNRFAAPSTTGTIDCAMLGYVLTLAFMGGQSPALTVPLIFACAIFGTLMLIKFLHSIKFKNAVFVPLIGIMYGNVIGALTTFIAYKYDLMQSLSAWSVANFAMVLQGNFELLYIAIPIIIITYFFASRFSAAGMGEHFAKNIGLNYQQVVVVGVMLVAILSTVVVMIVGEIPFLGLVVPNLVSLFMGDNIKRNLPYTAACGAILVLVCDMLGRVIIFPHEVPIAMIISVLGGLTFIGLIMRGRHG